jgi:hypothetical protein
MRVTSWIYRVATPGGQRRRGWFVRVINEAKRIQPGDHVPQDEVDKANKRGANGAKAIMNVPVLLTAWGTSVIGRQYRPG